MDSSESTRKEVERHALGLVPLHDEQGT